MFALPDAKRVRRSDLYAEQSSSSSSLPPPSSPDPELEAQLRARVGGLFPPLGPQDDDVDGVTSGVAVEEPAEKEVEFRLFGGPGEAVQKIILKDEVVVSGEGGLVSARDPRVWLLPRASGEKLAGLQMMAVSGDEVRQAARRRAWGLEVPWRVTVVQTHGKSGKTQQKVIVKLGNGEHGEESVGITNTSHAVGKTKKVGKKGRILLRERKKKQDELETIRRAAAEKKAESEKEKKIRKNRERKLKRRLKEKAKKAGGGLENGGDIAEISDSQNGDND